MDTTTIPAPIEGTLVVEEIRVAAAQPGPLQYVCAWANPDLPSEGTVVLDILGRPGHRPRWTRTCARPRASPAVASITEVSTSTELNLEGDLLTAFLGAAESGAADGLFATRAPFQGTSSPRRHPGDLHARPRRHQRHDAAPASTTITSTTAASTWEPEQGTAHYHGVNSKASYLRAWPGDSPSAPRVIALADLGVGAGRHARPRHDRRLRGAARARGRRQDHHDRRVQLDEPAPRHGPAQPHSRARSMRARTSTPAAS